MKITITDKVGLDAETVLSMAASLIKNRAPQVGEVDYGLESHGYWGGIDVRYPVVCVQEGRRATSKSPIHIVIKPHIPLF